MNPLGSNRELAENKLILLYIIKRVEIPISNLQITKLILENRFMNYFLLQQFLNELCDNGFLSQSSEGGKIFYSITEYGNQSLDYLINLIPAGIKRNIDNTINSIRKNIKNETLITADFIPESENKYVVYCKVHEDSFSLMDLKIAVGTKSDARTICNNWEKYSQEIYPEIIEILTRNRETKK